MLIVCVWAWPKRDTAAAARSFSWLALSGALWNAAHLVELASGDLSTKLLWDSLGTMAAVASGVLALVFACAYAGKRLPRWVLVGIVLAVVPPTWAIAVAPFAGWLRTSARLEPPYGALIFDLTAWDRAYIFELLALSIAALALLVSRLLRQTKTFRAQTAAVTLALALPMVVGFSWLFLDLRLQGERDVSHITFAASSIFLGWALSRGRLFDLVPIARDAVFENLTDAVLVLDRARRIVDANRAAATLLHRPLAMLAGRSAADALGGWPDLLSTANRDDARHDEIPAPPGASLRWFDVQWTPLHGTDGGWMGGTLVLRDVTDVRQARLVLERRVQQGTDDLAASERRFRALFDQTFQLIGLLDSAGTLLAVNRAALEMIRADEASVLGKAFWRTPWWTHAEDQQVRLKNAIGQAAGGEFVRFEATHIDHTGKCRFIDFSLTPVKDTRGRVVQIVPEGRDITSLHEAQLREAQLSQQLQQAQKMQAIGRLAGGIAHDFNNLLVVISGNVDLAKQELPLDSPLRPLLDEALQATTVAAGVTRQLLTFSRKQPLAPRHLTVADTLGEIGGILRRLVGPGADLEIRVSPDAWAICLDPIQLQQVLINLVVNARDATPEGGAISVDVENVELAPRTAACIPEGRAGEFLRLSVTDTGKGMTEEIRHRIFEPFFTTKPEGAGTGLGLAVVHGVVHQGGGFVDVASKPGHGSTFMLYFPRAP
jgi:PAS domain S-box-containing protein